MLAQAILLHRMFSVILSIISVLTIVYSIDANDVSVGVCDATILKNITENEKILCYYIDLLEQRLALLEKGRQNFDIKVDELRKFVEQSLNLKKLINESTHNSNSCDAGWFAYLDQKCFKVLDKLETEAEALAQCQSIDVQATLISIHSQNELNFLTNLLSNSNKLSDNIWIGLKFTNSSFQWLDKTDLDYDNWNDDAIQDGINACVQMTISNTKSIGKWTDNSCLRKSLVVCQRKQSSLSVIVKDLKNITKTIEGQQSVIDRQRDELEQLKTITIPIGFLYTQLPNQSAPAQLWPSTQWLEVTKQYSSLFFRVEGEYSEPFGEIQAQNYSRISNIRMMDPCGNPFSEIAGPGAVSIKHASIVEGMWSESVGYRDGCYTSAYNLHEMNFFTTKGENRPVNTAIKLWKRTG